MSQSIYNRTESLEQKILREILNSKHKDKCQKLDNLENILYKMLIIE